MQCFTPVKKLEKLGFEVTYLPVDETGRISLDELRAGIKGRYDFGVNYVW